MAEFKIGDRVHLKGRGDWPGWPGDARYGTVVGFRDEWVVVDHDAPSVLGRQKDCGWHAFSLERVSEPDPVNHPAHYTQYPVEVIEITEHLNFCRGNAVKYICRAGHKGDELEDLRKSLWYIKREIDRLEKSNE